MDVSIRCNGEYSYRISDPMLFYKNVCANVSDLYTRDQLDSTLKSEFLTHLQPAFARISGMGIRYSALPGHTVELADAMNQVLSSKWANLRGVSIVSVGVNSITASAEDEATIKELQKSAVFRNTNMAAAHMVQAQAEAMKDSRRRIYEVADAFAEMSGRRYGMIEEYMMDDAEFAVVLIGSSAGTAKAAARQLRDAGIKAGVVKVRVFRPFPWEELQAALSGVKAVAVMDKSEGFSGWGGPLFAETRAAMYDVGEAQRPLMMSFVYGLGGRDVTISTFDEIYGDLARTAEAGKVENIYRHVGVRGDEEGIQG
jgi:hypothetical protein